MVRGWELGALPTEQTFFLDFFANTVSKLTRLYFRHGYQSPHHHQVLSGAPLTVIRLSCAALVQ